MWTLDGLGLIFKEVCLWSVYLNNQWYMLAIFRFHALCLLTGLIKHWNCGSNCPLSLVCCLPCMWGQHPIYTSTCIKGILSRYCMFPLIENTDLMHTMYITIPHICFMTYMWTCKQKETLGRRIGIHRPAPWSGLDHFPGLIYFRVSSKWPLKPFPWFTTLLQQFVSVCMCPLKPDTLQPITFLSFGAENYKTVDSHGFAKRLKLESVLIKVARHRLPLLHPAKKKRKNNDEELYCESASKQPEFRVHEGNSSLSF